MCVKVDIHVKISIVWALAGKTGKQYKGLSPYYNRSYTAWLGVPYKDLNRTIGSFTLQFVSNIHSNCIREIFLYFFFLSKEKLLLLCLICKKEMCASFIFHRIYLILFFQARTNLWFNAFDSRQNLWYVTFSYVAEYVSFYFAMKEKSWFNTSDTQIWCFLTFPCTRQNLCCLTLPGKAELRPCLLCHINIWMSI
jgi:hypothetical protein